MDRNWKIQRYRSACFKYGLITLVYMIDQYQREENYEECAIILEAVNEVKRKVDMQFPTVYNEKTIQYFKDELFVITGTSGEIAIANVPYYAEEIKYSLMILEEEI